MKAALAPQRCCETLSEFFIVGRQRTSRVLAGLGIALLTALLLIQIAGPVSADITATRYERLELTSRAPAVIRFDQPHDSWQSAPASLGYFSGSHEFVYTAQESRGLIFGLVKGEVIVIEIAAPDIDRSFIQGHLTDIRKRVSQLNAQKNLLRLARQQYPRADREIEQQVAGLWSELDGNAENPGLEPVLDYSVATHNSRLADLTAQISAVARHQARLKRLYYEGQFARLQLLLSQFDLQVALAQLPNPEMNELLSLGDRRLVTQTTMDEIERLRKAWQTRRKDLDRMQAITRQWIARAEQRDDSTPANVLDMLLAPLRYYTREETTARDIWSSPRAQLEIALASGQSTIATTELDQISAGLALLTEAQEHVLAGGLPVWAELPRLSVKVAQSPALPLDQLAPELEVGLAGSATLDQWIELILALAKSFETSGNYTGELDFSPYPLEAAHGVQLINKWCNSVSVEDGEEDDNQAGLSLVDKLDLILAYPNEYSVGAYDLSFLRFVKWYVQLPGLEGNDLNAVALREQDDQEAKPSAQLEGEQFQ